jgi:hypothetical protein
VQQRVAVRHAIAGQEHVDGAVHGTARLAQPLIECGRLQGVVEATDLHHLQVQQKVARPGLGTGRGEASNHFKNNQIGYTNVRRPFFPSKPAF